MTPARIEQHRRIWSDLSGDASNLNPIAYGPVSESEFVGFDLAAHPIEHGKRFARTLGLKNVTLTTLDLADFPPAAGRFDYIIAHGLYSWIPAAARDRLFGLGDPPPGPSRRRLRDTQRLSGCYW